MAFPTGTHRLGPADATLSVRTTRTGAAAKAGHDLRIEVGTWRATLEVADDPAQTRLELTADAASMAVVEGSGGMQALDDEDKQNIKAVIDGEILERSKITFRSTHVEPLDGDGLHVDGDLTLVGTVHPISFDIAIADDRELTARAVVTQTRWGIKPYSTLFGALKVADDVEVTIDGRLPG